MLSHLRLREYNKVSKTPSSYQENKFFFFFYIFLLIMISIFLIYTTKRIKYFDVSTNERTKTIFYFSSS